MRLRKKVFMVLPYLTARLANCFGVVPLGSWYVSSTSASLKCTRPLFIRGCSEGNIRVVSMAEYEKSYKEINSLYVCMSFRAQFFKVHGKDRAGWG